MKSIVKKSIEFIQKHRMFVVSVFIVLVVFGTMVPVLGQGISPPPPPGLPFNGDHCDLITFSGALPTGSGWDTFLCFSYIVNGLAEFFGSVASGILAAILAVLSIGTTANTKFQDFSLVRVGWPIMRDVCNVGFIFALMIMSFATIFQMKQYAIGQNLLKLIIYAGLINFSLMIVGVLVDFSQVFLKVFIAELQHSALDNIIKSLKLFEAFKLAPGVDPGPGFGARVFTTTLIAAAIGWFAIKQFLKLLKLLAKRTIVIWITMALSPLLFVAPLLPGGKSISGKWWGEFSKALISGPAAAFFLFLAIHSFRGGAPGGGKTIQDIIDTVIIELFGKLV